MIRALALACVVSAAVGMLRATDHLGAARQQTTKVTGRVLDAATRLPLQDARVLLARVRNSPVAGSFQLGRGSGESEVLSAATGAFLFPDVQQGEYVLRSVKPGYNVGFLGQQSPTGTSVHLIVGPGDTATVQLLLWKAGAISGSVWLPSRIPAASYVVHALMATSTSLFIAGTAVVGPLGDYVLNALPPGKYIIAVADRRVWTLGSAFPLRSTPTRILYAPGVDLPVEADIISLSPSEERRLEITLTPQPVGVTVSGRLMGHATAEMCSAVRLVVMDKTASGRPPFELATARVGADGSFAFDYVPNGSYVIRGLCGLQREKAEPVHMPSGFLTSGIPILTTPSSEGVRWFSQAISVSGQSINGLSLTGQPGARVSGRVNVSPGSSITVSSLANAPVHAFPRDGWNLEGLLAGRVKDDGTFEGPPLPPGRFLVQPYSNGDWYVEKVTLDGRDVTDLGVEVGNADLRGLTVTVTTLRSRVTGVIRDETSRPRPDATIYFFPVDRRRWTPMTMAVRAAMRPGTTRSAWVPASISSPPSSATQSAPGAIRSS